MSATVENLITFVSRQAWSSVNDQYGASSYGATHVFPQPPMPVLSIPDENWNWTGYLKSMILLLWL